MPSKEVATDWAAAFTKAGHRPAGKYLRCSKCEMTLHDFLKKGKLPCLVS